MPKPRTETPLRSEYKALARILQESAPDLTSSDARQKLVAALMDAKTTPLVEAGKRNSSSDQQVLQTIHDHSVSLGAMCMEPDADDADEKATWNPDGVLLVEGAAFCEIPKLQESITADYPIKLISPGRGSSGYYGPEVLKTAAESRIFKAGTQMFWNHDTDAEEGARPEGDLNRLAAVTTTDARWEEAGHDGPGLYARAKVFSDYAEKVREKGPHIGLSIRAGGERDEAARAPDGKPRVITALKNAQSVDFVTKAGRDGKIFTESAGVAEIQHEETNMDEAQIKALIKESVAPIETKLSEAQAENTSLRKRLAKSEAPAIIREALKGIRFSGDTRVQEASTNKIIRSLAEMDLPEDPQKLNALIESKAQEEGRFLSELGYGVGIASIGTRVSEAQTREQSEAGEKDHKESYQKSLEWLAHTFVGKPLRVGSEEVKAARVEAIEAFKEGRAA